MFCPTAVPLAVILRSSSGCRRPVGRVSSANVASATRARIGEGRLSPSVGDRRRRVPCSLVDSAVAAYLLGRARQWEVSQLPAGGHAGLAEDAPQVRIDG